MKRVLLIDDDPVSNFINERVIMNAEFAEDIVTCISASKGLAFLEEVADKNPGLLPGLILLDIRMPAMDGFGFLEAFSKLSPAIRESIKIVMLTSSLEELDRSRSFKYAYVIDFINKPLTEEKLRELEMKLKGVY